MYRRALDGYKKAWGPEHTSTLRTVNNLGCLYKDQGKLAEAEKMCQRALDGREKAWGPEHISTLSTIHNLGHLYKDQGKLVEAEKMYRQALDGYEKLRGPNHPTTKLIGRNLSIALGTLKLDDGISLQRLNGGMILVPVSLPCICDGNDCHRVETKS